MRVIGTAGHVDHGKSTLVEALTGTHPDRLQEERDREMTIVLGFAWFTLTGGEEVGIVDVPGHRDFIENMLSGIGAIDAALFIVAADEGVMPQTREHLAILDLLQIQSGVVVLTKVDLIDDPEWLDLVESDLIETLSGTVLESAPIVRASAKTGAGIPQVFETLELVLNKKPHRPDLGRPRLPVDRVFTMPGFGTIVTGTLTDGHISIGDDVQILPSGSSGRVRGLQTHKRKENTAIPGSRTAVNISGIDVVQVSRGDVVTHPGDYIPTRRLDVRFRLLPDVKLPVKHNLQVKLFIGASEVLARLRLLGTDVLQPGDEGWLQLELQSPVVAIRGDRYIVRRPSPGETLGGGVVVDPHPPVRHKRFNRSTLDRLEQLLTGSPEDILLQSILVPGITTIGEALSISNLEPEIGRQALDHLAASQKVIFLDGDLHSKRPKTLITSREYWHGLIDQFRNEVSAYHGAYPLRQGIPREELKSRIKLGARVFNAVISKMLSEGFFSATSMRKGLPGINPIPVIFQTDHSIQITPELQHKVDQLLDNFESTPYAPPTIKSCVDEIGEDLFNALVDLGELMPVSGDVVFRWADYRRLVDQVKEMITKGGSITVAQMRDRFKTSRRYVLAFLEHLDTINLTVREGDERKLKK